MAIGRVIGKIRARTRTSKKHDSYTGRTYAYSKGIASTRTFGRRKYQLARPEILNVSEARRAANSVRHSGYYARVIKVNGGYVVYESVSRKRKGA